MSDFKQRLTDSGDPTDAERRLTKEFAVPRDVAKAAIEAVFLPTNPGELTTWGVTQGLTSVAKTLAYAEGRVALAATAGELLRGWPK